MIQLLETEAVRIEDVILLGEDLQEKLGTSGSHDVSLKLDSIGTLKQSLAEDLSSQLGELDNSLKKWEGFTKLQGEFKEWIVDFEGRFGDVTSTEIQLDTPEKLKVRFINIFQHSGNGYMRWIGHTLRLSIATLAPL